jgi:hypothetical protein
MQVATTLPKSLTKKKMSIIATAVGIPVVLAAVVMGFFIIQGGTTSASELAPSNVDIQTKEDGTAVITWETGQDSLAVLEYGLSPEALNEVAFSELETTFHNINLNALEPNTTYYFQIRSGDTVYDNGGSLWEFQSSEKTTAPTEAPFPVVSGAPAETPPVSPVASPSATIAPTPSLIASPSATLTPAGSPTPTATISATLTPTPADVCKSNNCVSILQQLGSFCNTQHYVQCLMNANVTITQGATNTPSPTPISSAVKSACAINSFQSNSCSSWSWDDMTSKEKTCSDTFTKYFVQCKGNSWESEDATTWYCNKTVTSNQLSLPCDTAPTPAPGQSIFCRVRAETEVGGDTNATDWIYTNGSCSSYANLSSVSNCQIGYVQQNTCGSWNWSLNDETDPQCVAAFDHYKVQCTSNGILTTPGATTPTPYWYCNTTSTTTSLDLPCGNAITPANGAVSTCRVRPEDAYGTDSHAGDWVTTSATCPTSTPTPTTAPTATTAP